MKKTMQIKNVDISKTHFSKIKPVKINRLEELAKNWKRIIVHCKVKLVNTVYLRNTS